MKDKFIEIGIYDPWKTLRHCVIPLAIAFERGQEENAPFVNTAKRIKGTSKKLYKGTAIKFAKNPFNAKPLKKKS